MLITYPEAFIHYMRRCDVDLGKVKFSVQVGGLWGLWGYGAVGLWGTCMWVGGWGGGGGGDDDDELMVTMVSQG